MSRAALIAALLIWQAVPSSAAAQSRAAAVRETGPIAGARANASFPGRELPLAAHDLRPGRHTLSFQVANARNFASVKTWDAGIGLNNTIACQQTSPHAFNDQLTSSSLVGWGQANYGGSRCAAFVSLRAIDFDLARITGSRDVVVTSAELSFQEVKPPAGACANTSAGGLFAYVDKCWSSGGGNDENKPNGCVVVRVPAVNWRGLGTNSPPPTLGGRPKVVRLASNRWDVTEPVALRLSPGNGALVPAGSAPPSKGFGFLLASGPSINELEGRDKTVCLSTVQNVVLTISYTVSGPASPR